MIISLYDYVSTLKQPSQPHE